MFSCTVVVGEFCYRTVPVVETVGLIGIPPADYHVATDWLVVVVVVVCSACRMDPLQLSSGLVVVAGGHPCTGSLDRSAVTTAARGLSLAAHLWVKVLMANSPLNLKQKRHEVIARQV